jgi:fermentation-respiration switch protein FrsA (DUF1100 family)
VAAPAVQGLDGDWDGTLVVNGGMKLRLALHVKTTAEAGSHASLDSVDQGANGILVSAIRRQGQHVVLEVAAIRGGFEGDLSSDGSSLTGNWRQAGASLPLTLTRRPQGAAAPTLYRPQTPAEPFPYKSEEVAYDNAAAPSVRLAGTLTLPSGKGPFPAAILIAGSGPNRRDEDILGHKLFLVLADHLTRQGLAVLRYDKRGVGQSSGDYAHATSREFAADTEAGLAYLRTRKDIDPARIGLIGHSEGGLIAPIVAAVDPKVAFIVLMAAPGESGRKILLDQGRLIAIANGMDPRKAAETEAFSDKLYQMVLDEKDPARASAQAKQMLADYAKAHDLPAETLEAQVDMLNSAWMRAFMVYDPVPTLRQVRCPVLAIAGAKDLQVPPDDNLAAIKGALGADRDVTVQELAGLNHLFQPAHTGSPAEYGEIEQTMSPVALDTVSAWVLKRFGAPAV